jgi:hypothetical protein
MPALLEPTPRFVYVLHIKKFHEISLLAGNLAGAVVTDSESSDLDWVRRNWRLTC